MCSHNSIVWWNVLLISWVILAFNEKLLRLFYLLCCRSHIEFTFQFVSYGPRWLFWVLVGLFSNNIHGIWLGDIVVVCDRCRFRQHITNFLRQVSLAATLRRRELAFLYSCRCLVKLFVIIVSPSSLWSSMISSTRWLLLTRDDQFVWLLSHLFDLFCYRHEILTVVNDWCGNFPLALAVLCLDIIRLILAFPTVINSFGEVFELSHGAWGFNKLTYSTADNPSKDW